MAKIQENLHSPTPEIFSDSYTPNKQQLSIAMTGNNIVESILKCNSCNHSYSLSLKYTKITEGQKLADFIYTMIKELKLCYEGKTDITEQVIK